MAYLFTVLNNSVVPNPEVLMIKPFKEIVERDVTKRKDVALKEFAYIEFMSSKKKTNPFAGYDDSIKESKIIERVFDYKYKPDKLVKEAIKFIEKLYTDNSPSYSFYLAAKSGAEKIKNFLIDVDVDELHPKTGNRIHKPQDILKTLNETSKTLVTLAELKRKIESEDITLTRTRGEQVISPYANPNKVNKIRR
jgi:hypothetical protein